MRSLPLALLTILAAGMGIGCAQDWPLPPPPFNVRLDVTPSRTLPSIPVTLRVTMENTARQRAELPREVFLLVTPEGGEPFVARNATRGAGINESNGAIFVKYWPETFVEPRKTVTLEIEPDGAFGVPLWFEDERIHRPGRYRLEVLLGYGVATDTRFRALEHALVRSTPATLEVSEPQGDDATVWAALQALFEKRPAVDDDGHDRRAAKKEILTKYPDSTYAGWVLMSGVAEGAAESSALTRQWLRDHPDAPHADARWLAVAENELFLATRGGPDSGKKAAHEREAKRLLKQLSGSKSAAVRRQAEAILKDLDD